MLLRRVLPAFLLVAALAGCSRKPALPPDVIARVNERHVTLADYKRYLERNTGAELAQIGPEVASAVLDQFLEEVVLAEYAALRGIDIPAEKIAAAVRTDPGSTVIEKRDAMRRQKLIADETAKIAPPSDDAIRAFYEKNQQQFRAEEQVKVRQILVHDQALANEIVTKLRAGADFAELSAAHSEAANARRGGDIGFISRGELPRMFEEVIFALNPGDVSDVITTNSSYHVFRIDERRQAGQLSLEAATPLIAARLHEDAIREQIAQELRKARSEMAISVLPKRLPFRYSGTFPRAGDE